MHTHRHIYIHIHINTYVHSVYGSTYFCVAHGAYQPFFRAPAPDLWLGRRELFGECCCCVVACVECVVFVVFVVVVVVLYLCACA